MSTAPDEPLGSAAQEAARLVETVQEWFAGQRGEPGSEPAPGQADDAARSAHDAGSCRVCPLCRALSAAQQARPEVVGHLASAAEHLAAALRELASGSPDAGRAAGGGPPDAPGRPAGSPRTQHIVVEPDPGPEQHRAHPRAGEPVT